MVQGQRERPVPEADSEFQILEALVGARPARVGPHERDDRRGEADPAASDLKKRENMSRRSEDDVGNAGSRSVFNLASMGA